MSPAAHLQSLDLPSSPDDHVFVLRFWLERSGNRQREALWRGRVTYMTYANAKAGKHINSIDEALELVRSLLNAASR